MAKKYIFVIGENTMTTTHNESIYVRATEGEIRQRMYVGGFLRFLSSWYDYADNYKGKDARICGQKIIGLKAFDQWRKEHRCV